MPPKTTWVLKGGSVLSTRQVPPQEKRAMREQMEVVWAGFDSTYADKYDKQEPACKRAKRSEKDSQTAEPACKRAKRSEKDSQTAELCSDDPNDPRDYTDRWYDAHAHKFK